MTPDFEKMLTGGKAFSLGRTVEVVDAVVGSPELFTDYLNLFSSQNVQVVMRASNGLKRIFDEEPDGLSNTNVKSSLC